MGDMADFIADSYAYWGDGEGDCEDYPYMSRRTWTPAERRAYIQAKRQESADLIPDLEDERPEYPEETPTIGTPELRWVKRGHIMRFHPQEFFQRNLIQVVPGEELLDSDATPYYADSEDGSPLREFYGHIAPPEPYKIFTVFE